MVEILVVDHSSGRLVNVAFPDVSTPLRKRGGGNRPLKAVSWNLLSPFVDDASRARLNDTTTYVIMKYAPKVTAELALEDTPGALAIDVPLGVLVDHLTLVELKAVAKIHLVSPRNRLRQHLVDLLKAHRCAACEQYLTVFVPAAVDVDPKPVAHPPRTEYLADMLPSIKLFSREEIMLYCEVPSDLVDEYVMGGKVVGLREASCPRPPEEALDAGALTSLSVPWMLLGKKGTRKLVQAIAHAHGLALPLRLSKADALEQLATHDCSSCTPYEITFSPFRVKLSPPKPAPELILEPVPVAELPHFPPNPMPFEEETEIIRDFCKDLNPTCFEEGGCAVCGQLTLRSNLTPLSTVTCSLDPLIEPGLVRLERRSSLQPVAYDNGPVLEKSLSHVCGSCLVDLDKGKRPLNALANGLWVGAVPPELRHLTFVEQLLVARVRTNRCVVRVSRGQSKMTANAITFSSPMAKVYHHLPPPRHDLEEGLAFLFTGVSPPTDEELKRTPMLVRRNVVKRALDWLKLNHSDYGDLQIDYVALRSYPEEGIPVHVKKVVVEDGSNLVAAATSVHDTQEEHGVSSGACPFTVCGLVGSNLDSMSMATRKAVALHHLRVGGSVLAIGHSEKPESMYDNPQLYPQIFPWIFPYGAGGMGNARLRGLIAESNQKKLQLMYFDKRFQTDSRFVIIAFNQEQVKMGATGSMILARRSNFSSVVSKVLRINPAVIASIARRLQEGERVVPFTDEEKACFNLMDQIDHVSGRIHGSAAAKKMRRNELWSLITNKGAPSWFVTLSPADNLHPLCIYWADKNETFKPDLRHCNERARLIAKNPVAGARFFNFMVLLFIKHLLRWADPEGRRGVFGDTGAYYGTVEQQGRMTLHLHILIWIVCALSPQEVRDRLTSKDSEFTAELIAYLENCQTGEFLTGTMEDMVNKYGPLKKDLRSPFSDASPTSVPDGMDDDDPTQTLPVCPPPKSSCEDVASCICQSCLAVRQWKVRYSETVDNVLYRSNVHTCYVRRDVIENGVHKKHVTGKGCVNKDGVCTARFPRKIYEQTEVDDEGHINLKKLESRINTVNRTMAYCYRCNTDCTCLSSGTAVKATVGYVADYIVKMGLKTYQIFSSIYDVFERNPDVIGESKSESDAARRLILKMANSLTSKVEVGGPMAAMYLLGHPDHYSSHTFTPLYWKQYVTYVLNEWDKASELNDPESCVEEECAPLLSTFGSARVEVSHAGENLCSEVRDEPDLEQSEEDNVMVSRSYGRIMSRSHVDDYRLRPVELESVCLYDWIQCSTRRPLSDPSRLPAGHLRYREEHPLVNTHSIQWDIGRMDKVVPNIIGPYLPRPNEDDADYYATTMLTLFAPWRTGLELKSSVDSWTSALESREIASRHRDIIRNMNIRYECYDARDDYHAQLRSQTAAQNIEVLENPSDDEGDYDEEDVDVDFTDEAEVGTWSKSKQAQMKELELVLHAAGWSLDGCSNRPPLKDNLQPERALSAAKWRDVVATERRKILAARAGPSLRSSKHLEDDMDVWCKTHNDARIIPGAYLLDDFQITDATEQEMLDNVLSEFTLNTEQLRAFNIVAHHSLSLGAEPLRMYIGGMAGTGKTRVIDALRSWFRRRAESHRMVVLAPTGAAASVVSGSTYHSFLGVATGDRRSHAKKSQTALDEARLRMMNVDYIFLDEISMVSCHDFYLIDAKLKEITRLDDVPFGGINFIVAGDFAQLPPAKGCALYSGEVSKVQLPRQTQSDQENTLGMLLWHHIVTVVILRQNMRQSESTPEDDALRTCLENMRYKSCTQADLNFLRTLIPSSNDALNMNDPMWRDVSVITSWNTHKDQINEMSSKRFAYENKRPLSYFYSIDKQGRQGTGTRKGRKGKAPRVDQDATNVRLTPQVQEALWSSQPHTSEHIAGRLAICIGMPVMIRNNDATELNITKGQEAIVRGWSSREIPSHPGKQSLEVLFVELAGKVVEKIPVKIPHLPKNVVPLTKISTSIKAVLPNDSSVTLNRQQIPVLQNFAMTDYASQGKTRAVNVVDVRRSRNHQAMYTALSRGQSARGTLILRDFNDAKVTGGLSGYLREEFRALELLDEITLKRYQRELPGDAIKPLRASTIISYREWKKSIALLGSRKATVDSIAREGSVSSSGVLTLHDVEIPVVPQASGGPAVTADHSVYPIENAFCTPQSEHGTSLRKRRANETSDEPAAKRRLFSDVIDRHCSTLSSKRRREEEMVPEKMGGPMKKQRTLPNGSEHNEGALWRNSWKWDSTNWSCAFDSVLTVLRFVWHAAARDDPRGFAYSGYLDLMFQSFLELEEGDISLELCRFRIRERCWALDRTSFPKGRRGTDVYSLMHVLYGYKTATAVSGASVETCRVCGSTQDGELFDNIGRYVVLRVPHGAEGVQQVSSHLQRVECQLGVCSGCGSSTERAEEYCPMMTIQLPEVPPGDVRMRWCIDPLVHLSGCSYRLAGVVYWGRGDEHFTARLHGADGTVYRYDGMLSDGLVEEDRDIGLPINGLDFDYMDQKEATLAIYLRIR